MTGAVTVASPPAALTELDAWLAASEGRWPDIRPESEARIVWANGEVRERPLALVYLHGFSASRMETAPFCDRIAERLDANVFYARLTGHGRSDPGAMGEASVDAWYDDARRALEIGARIGRRVILVGTSTGGTLATLEAATRDLPELAALVLLAPNFGVADPRAFLLRLPGARRWLRWVVGAERVIEAQHDAHARYWSLRYPVAAMVPMMHLVTAVWRAPLERIEAPVLAMFSEEDKVVDARRTRALLARMNRAEVTIETLPPLGDGSDHVVVGDAFAPQNTPAAVERCLAFLEEHGITAHAESRPAAELL